MLRSIILAASCATTLLVLTPRSGAAQRREQDRDRITRAEIDAAPRATSSVYELVRSLRPHFLQPPAGGRPDVPILLYVDGRREAGVDALKSMAVRAVEDVRYFDPRTATGEFGSRAANGAVIVKLRRRVTPEGGASREP
jgi:hypothetical protein